MAQKPKRGTGMPLPPAPPEGGPDDQDYVYMSPGEQQAVQPYYGLPLMTPEMRRYRVGGRQMMDPRNFEFARQMREKAAQGTRLKKGGPVKYEGGGKVEIEIKVGGGGKRKGMHKMPDGSMMEDEEHEAEEYRKGGMVKPKAPVKKAMGGKVAAKPMGKPVMKKAGGRVAAKPMMKGRKK